MTYIAFFESSLNLEGTIEKFFNLLCQKRNTTLKDYDDEFVGSQYRATIELSSDENFHIKIEFDHIQNLWVCNAHD